MIEKIFEVWWTYPILFITTFFWEKLWLLLSGLWAQINSNLPNLAGSWNTNFIHKDDSGESDYQEEIAMLKQIGRFVFGTIKYNDENITEEFKFRGNITRNTLSANFIPIGGKKNGVGYGVFQLTIKGNETEMDGYATWHDYDSDQTESSKYKWIKQT